MIFGLKKDGFISRLVGSIFGSASRQEEGEQNSGGHPGHGAGQVIGPDTALKISAVWACIRLIAEAVGSMPLKVYDLDADGERTENREHWLYDLLNGAPNNRQTRNEFFETLIINLMLAGNFYCRIPKRGGRVLSIEPLVAPQVEVAFINGERRYTYTNGAKRETFGQDQIWHMPMMPSNGIVGLSPLQYAARTMGIAISAEDRVATLARNGFKTTGVLMVDRVLTPDQRKAIRKNFNDLQEGQGDPLKVLEAHMKFQQIAISPKDVQLLESRRFSIEDLCRIFGVPSILVNDSNATTAWGSGIGEIKEGWNTFGLRPLTGKLESSIMRWLLSPAERKNMVVEFDHTAFLRGSFASQVDTATKAVNGNLKTINEARKMLGDPSIGPEGDVMYAQKQMIPLGEQAETEDNDNPEPAENPDDGPGDGAGLRDPGASGTVLPFGAGG